VSDLGQEQTLIQYLSKLHPSHTAIKEYENLVATINLQDVEITYQRAELASVMKIFDELPISVVEKIPESSMLKSLDAMELAEARTHYQTTLNRTTTKLRLLSSSIVLTLASLKTEVHCKLSLQTRQRLADMNNINNRIIGGLS